VSRSTGFGGTFIWRKRDSDEFTPWGEWEFGDGEISQDADFQFTTLNKAGFI